jgi:hypothetical protein
VNRAIGIAAVAAFVAGCATPVTSKTPAAPASASDAAGGEWQLVDLPNSDASFNGIAATDHDVVIVGGRAMGPVAWVSHDGGEWIFEQLAPADAIPGTAVAFGDRVIAVGTTQTNRCAHPYETFFWVRDADARWATAPFDKLFCAGNDSSPAVAGGRLAMVGTGTADIPFAWFSDDGLTWLDRPIRRDVYPRFVTSAGGGFAAIGNFIDDGWWIGRSDGRQAWAIAPLRDVPLRAEALGLASRGNRLIAWFTAPAGDIGALTSETGLVWQSAQVEGMTGATPGRIIRTAAGYVALAEMPDAKPGLFVSRDGVTWHAVAGPIDSRPGNYVGLAIAGDRAILLRNVRVGEEGTPTVWSAPSRILEP